MTWYKLSQSSTPLPKNKWGFKSGDPVEFINNKTGKMSAGIFSKAYMSPNFPSFPSEPMAHIYIGGNKAMNNIHAVPLKNIKYHDTSNIKVGDDVNLVLYQTESPAKVVSVLDNNQFEVLGQSMRRFKVFGYELV